MAHYQPSRITWRVVFKHPKLIVMAEQKTKPSIRYSAFDEVRKLNNEQLQTLLKEIKEISEQKAPRYFKQSDKMKQLFKLEKIDYYTWADQFSNVQKAIEIEILWRIKTDAW